MGWSGRFRRLLPTIRSRRRHGSPEPTCIPDWRAVSGWAFTSGDDRPASREYPLGVDSWRCGTGFFCTRTVAIGSMSDSTPIKRNSNGRLVTKLAVLVVAMFGFGYLMVPLYDVFCEITGIGGKTGVVSADSAKTLEMDKERWVTVEFTGNVAASMPWEFRPLVKKLRVHPGEIGVVSYYARNSTARRMVGQAVPSVTPSRSSRYFNKTECFCFTNQVLEAGEAREMPVRFVIDPKLPKDVHTITLSYAFFNAAGLERDTSNDNG